MWEVVKKIIEWCKSKACSYILDSFCQIFGLRVVATMTAILTWISDIPYVFWIPIYLFTWCLYLKIKIFLIDLKERSLKSSLKIIYYHKCNKEITIFNLREEYNEKWFMFVFGIINISKTTRAESVSVMIEGVDDVSHELYYTKDTRTVDVKNPIYNININPNLTAYFILVASDEASFKGKSITLTASGKNITPTIEEIIL